MKTLDDYTWQLSDETEMTEPILSPDYWRRRLLQAQHNGQLHHAIFKNPLGEWRRIEAKHRQILAETVGPCQSVLDAGCGWGRLLELMPPTWRGVYVGVDISPDFVKMAEERHPDRSFLCADLRSWRRSGPLIFDWGIMVSMRPMVRRNLGDDAWAEIEANIRACCDKLLYLEYDENNQGGGVE